MAVPSAIDTAAAPAIAAGLTPLREVLGVGDVTKFQQFDEMAGIIDLTGAYPIFRSTVNRGSTTDLTVDPMDIDETAKRVGSFLTAPGKRRRIRSDLAVMFDYSPKWRAYGYQDTYIGYRTMAAVRTIQSAIRRFVSNARRRMLVLNLTLGMYGARQPRIRDARGTTFGFNLVSTRV